ncbi:MAG: CBS domain-containing protein [Candidatus Eisenbacteria bacterium]
MKVRELMDRRPVVCSTTSTLDEAMHAMQRLDCDALPVSGPDGRTALGMISGRDIALALATHHHAAHEITVGEVVHAPAVVVAPDDEVRELLTCMAHHRLRRVLVADANGRLEGTVGIEELLRHARLSGARNGGLSAKDVLETLRAIWTAPRPARVPPAAAEIHASGSAPEVGAAPVGLHEEPASSGIGPAPVALPVH